MNMFGYYPNKESVCFGIVCKEIEAYLITQQKEFDDRIRLIFEFSLADNIKTAKNKAKKLKKEIAIEVMKGFCEYSITAFNTKIYVTYANHYGLRELFEVLHHIPEHKIDENRARLKTNRNVNLLMIAAYDGHLDIVNDLLANGAEVDLSDEEGFTAFHVAAQNGHLNVVNVMFTKDIAVDSVNKGGFTALHLSVDAGHLKVVEALFNKGADVNLGNGLGTTALHLAAENGHFEIVKLLIANGASIDFQTNEGIKNGRTALHEAALNGHIKVVKFLLENHANVNLVDKLMGYTAAFFAAKNGHVEVLRLLMQSHPEALKGKDAFGFSLAEMSTTWPEVQNLIKEAEATASSTSSVSPIIFSRVLSVGSAESEQSTLPFQPPINTFEMKLMQ